MGVRPRRRRAAFVVSTLAAAAVLPATFPFGSAASPLATLACPAATGGTPGHVLVFNVCGPREVTRNKSYAYTIVLTNSGGVDTGKVKLSVFHYDPITRSSIPPDRDSSRRVQNNRYEAVWLLDNLAPGRSFRVTVTVTLPRQKTKANYTELVVKAVGQHSGAAVGAK